MAHLEACVPQGIPKLLGEVGVEFAVVQQQQVEVTKWAQLGSSVATGSHQCYAAFALEDFVEDADQPAVENGGVCFGEVGAAQGRVGEEFCSVERGEGHISASPWCVG